MSQKRLNIFTRKKSGEELSLEDRIKHIQLQIRSQRKEITNTKAKLNKRREQQQANGLQLAEVEVTDELIKSKVKPLTQHLKLLESKYESLLKKRDDVQKSSLRQQDIFGN